MRTTRNGKKEEERVAALRGQRSPERADRSDRRSISKLKGQDFQGNGEEGKSEKSENLRKKEREKEGKISVEASGKKREGFATPLHEGR